MFLKYGGYQHPTDEAYLTGLSRVGDFVNGISRGYKERWSIAGMLFGTSAADLTASIAVMKAAYSNQAQDIGFYNNDGSVTALFLSSASCLGGARVTGPISFSDLRGAQYTTYVNYTLAVEGDVYEPNTNIIMWRETLQFSGGGPLTVWLEPLNGPPQKQLLKQQTVYKAVQSGSAIGMFAPPVVPPPLWPFALKKNPDFSETGPERKGPYGQAFYTEFPVSWMYQFEDANPFVGSPTLWPN